MIVYLATIKPSIGLFVMLRYTKQLEATIEFSLRAVSQETNWASEVLERTVSVMGGDQAQVTIWDPMKEFKDRITPYVNFLEEDPKKKVKVNGKRRKGEEVGKCKGQCKCKVNGM